MRTCCFVEYLKIKNNVSTVTIVSYVYFLETGFFLKLKTLSFIYNLFFMDITKNLLKNICNQTANENLAFIFSSLKK